MIGGITHLTMEAGLERGIAFGQGCGFALESVDDIRLPAAFEQVEDVDHQLPLALLGAGSGIRLEVVDHRRVSGRIGAYSGLFRCAPPVGEATVRSRLDIRELLIGSEVLRDPVCVGLGVCGGEAWFEADADAASSSAGLAGIVCRVGDVGAETDFWSWFAGARWQQTDERAALGSVPAPARRSRDALVIVHCDEADAGHAMNDAGFPSIGVYSTTIEADCAKAMTAGAKLRAEPIVTDVAGGRVRMALIETPGGALVELLTVERD